MTVLLASVEHKTMWADSGCSDGSLIPKLFKHKNEILGICGNVAAARKAIKWYKEGKKEAKKPTFNELDDFLILILRDNDIATLNSDLIEMPVNNKVWHAGTGGLVAYTAYLCGKTPEECIQMACFLDSNCKPPVQSLTISRRRGNA
jgi:hypothetical protein